MNDNSGSVCLVEDCKVSSCPAILMERKRGVGKQAVENRTPEQEATGGWWPNGWFGCGWSLNQELVGPVCSLALDQSVSSRPDLSDGLEDPRCKFS